jgi:hypothetical protein
MKNFYAFMAAMLIGVSAYAQGPVTRYLEGRFSDGSRSQVFMEKGSHAIGLSGGYRSFHAVGDPETETGYSLLSILTVGDGQVQVWNVTPSFSTFIADDLSLGVALNYTGYVIDTDLNLDIRDMIGSTNDLFNLNISNRRMRHHSGGASVVLRKYVPFFGSKYVAVFGEGRLQGTYGVSSSDPREEDDYNVNRKSYTYGVALKAGGGVAIKLKDNSAITVSIPLFGVGYNYSKQDKLTTTMESIKNPDTGQWEDVAVPVQSKSHMSSFNATRNLDFLGIQFGYVRYIEPRRR